jgi:hypothetical protein
VATSGDYTDLINLPTLFDGAYSSLTGVPSTFAPAAHTLGSHSDVTVSLAFSGQYLRWDGSAWRNASITAGDLPSLDASKISTGIFNAARIPNLATSKITSGTFADARIAQSNVTQHQAALAIARSQITGVLDDIAGEFLSDSALTTGEKKLLRAVEAASTISTASIVLDASDSITVTVRKYTPSAGSLGSATALGTISTSSAQHNRSTGLSWSVAAGDVLELEITTAPSTATQAVISLGRTPA